MKATEKEFQSALLTRVHAASLHHEYVRASKAGEDGRAEVHADAIRRIVPSGLYEHWKSANDDAKYYLVSDVMLVVDMHDAFVEYRSLYGKRAGKSAGRPLFHQVGTNLAKEDIGFLTPIDRPQYRGPRFRLIEPLTAMQIATILGYVRELKLLANPVLLRLEIDKILGKKKKLVSSS